MLWMVCGVLGGTAAPSTATDFMDRDQPAALRQLAAGLAEKWAGSAPPTLPQMGETLRLRLLHPERFGIPAGITDPAVGYDSGAYQAIHTPGQLPGKTLQEAQRLLSDGAIGPPGAVDWERIADRHGARVLTPLALAYLETGDNRYLDRWCGFLDDWSLREHADFWPIQCPPEHSKGAPATLHLLKLWGGIAKRREERGEPFPVHTFLRSLDKLLPEYPLMSVAHHRGNPRNWTVENAYFYAALGFYLDDFAVGRELQREGLRVVESYAVTHNMRDGTENQQMLGYNLMYLHSGTKIAALWRDAFRTGNLPPHGQQLYKRQAWQDILHANLRDRAIRMLRMVTAEKRTPATLRTDLRDFPLEEVAQKIPGDKLDPASQAIVQWFRSQKKGTPPPVTSEHFPYGGYTVIRSGWGPGDSQGFLFSSPQPGATAGFNSERNNNALTLSAFGDDVIVSGDRGAYTHRPSPIRADGKEQAFHLGLLAPLAAWDTPSRTRFHTSEQAVLAEGFYAGPYGNRPRGDAAAKGLKKAMESALWKTRHHRVVVFVKPATWVVFDTMASDAPRDYTLDWRLPLEPVAGAKAYRTFRMEDIALQDSPLHRVMALRPGGTHVNLAFVADSPLQLRRNAERSGGEKPGAPVSDFCRISANWRGGKGNSGILSLIQPWRDRTPPGIPVEESNATQMGLASPAGTMQPALTARMARSGTAGLACGDLHAEAQLLVAWIPPEGGMRGVVLGCASLRWQGKPAGIPSEDFEFCRTEAGGWTFREIHPPVDHVQVTPNRALLDAGEPVTLSCPTPGTVIRYTLDGSPVTAASPRYESPFDVGPAVWLRARAFRKEAPAGLEPGYNNLASPETRASLRRAETPWPPVSRGREMSLAAGLRETTSRGRWSTLWLGGSGGPSGPDILHLRQGLVMIPRTGIYTFHAPESWTHDNRAGGYDLTISVDGQTWFPETQRHAFGTWSIPLEKGPHLLTIRWVDFRRDAVARFNVACARLNPIWEGADPGISVSGPGLQPAGPVPPNWLFHEEAR